MKAHAEQTFKLTIELDHDEAEIIRESLGFVSGELKRKPIGEGFKLAKALYEQLADEMNERTWRE